MSVNEKMTALADAIRSKTGKTGLLTLDGMIEDVNSITSGDNHYDEFWDSFQVKGTIYSANYMYAGPGWNDTNFYPKYSQTYMTSAGSIFNMTKITDLKGRLEEMGVVFNFQKCTNLGTAFAYGKLTRIPEINASTASNFSNTFYSSPDLISIDKIILKNDGSQTWSGSFYNCTSLESVTFEGVIGQSIDFQYSTKLNKESIISIIEHLTTNTATGRVLTLSLTAVNNAFETSKGAADGSTSSEWTTLRATKSNWTVSLV